MSKFFVSPSAVGDKFISIDSKDDLHHLTKVLRAREGDRVDISDGEKWEYSTVIETVTPDEAILRIVDRQAFSTEPETEITLYQGVPKAQKMELIIQKNVELGIHRIVPVFMDRTVVVDNGGFSKKLDRWQKISDEAVKQCKRGIEPEISKPLDFAGMLDEFDREGYDLVMCPYENEEGYSIKDCLKKFGEDAKNREKAARIAVVIGPEGGFSDGEIEKVRAKGIETVTLGKTILRTETAGFAATAMIMYELEL